MEKLCNELSANSGVVMAVKRLASHDGNSARTAIRALNLLVSKNGYTSYAQRRVERACELCRLFDPSVKDFVTLLLYGNVLPGEGRLLLGDFRMAFRESEYADFFAAANSASKQANKLLGNGSEDKADRAIAISVCRAMIERVHRSLNESGRECAYDVLYAFELAQKAAASMEYNEALAYLSRIVHPAELLCENGARSETVSASILEQGYAAGLIDDKSILKQCCASTASLVRSAVTVFDELDRTDDPGIFSDYDRISEQIREDDAFVYSAAIHAAHLIDRLTYDRRAYACAEAYSEYDRQKEYSRFLRRLRLNHFDRILDDLNWKNSDPARYYMTETAYCGLLQLEEGPKSEIFELIRDCADDKVNKYAEMHGRSGFEVSVYERDHTPHEISAMIADTESDSNPSPYVDKRHIPICDFNVVLGSECGAARIDAYIPVFVKKLGEEIGKVGAAITDFFTDSDNAVVFVLEDGWKNSYRCRVIRDEDHDVLSPAGIRRTQERRYTDPRDPGDTITVYVRNNRAVELPNGSTVIDIAYWIHREVGDCVKSAMINGKMKPVTTVLEDNDRIVVYSDTERKDQNTVKYEPHVMLDWLNYTKTPFARRCIMKYVDSEIRKLYCMLEGGADATHHKVVRDDKGARVKSE